MKSLRGFAFLFLLIASYSIAQTESAFPHYTQSAGNVDADGLPTSGVRLCLLPEKSKCFVMPRLVTDPRVIYEFGLEPHSEREPIAGGASWIFFTGMFSGGGSGTLTRFAVLRYDPLTKSIQNMLPIASATNVSEYAMWHIPEVSSYPVLVIADFFWNFDAGETHFDHHQYDVEAWTYSPTDHEYERQFRYRTSHKYDSETLHVLKSERGEILKHLQGK